MYTCLISVGGIKTNCRNRRKNGSIRTI